MRYGSAAPLVLGALAFDPATASALTCDLAGSGSVSVRCSDPTLGQLAVTTSGDQYALSYDNAEVGSVYANGRATDALPGCEVCAIVIGHVKGHPACLSGFDPVVDPVVEEALDAVMGFFESAPDPLDDVPGTAGKLAGASCQA